MSQTNTIGIIFIDKVSCQCFITNMSGEILSKLVIDAPTPLYMKRTEAKSSLRFAADRLNALYEYYRDISYGTKTFFIEDGVPIISKIILCGSGELHNIVISKRVLDERLERLIRDKVYVDNGIIASKQMTFTINIKF